MSAVRVERVPCLSDGAIASMREDLTDDRPVAAAYAAKALDEIAWLRARERELERQIGDWCDETGYASLEALRAERDGQALSSGPLPEAGPNPDTCTHNFEPVELLVNGRRSWFECSKCKLMRSTKDGTAPKAD